jgi:peptide-methionine (S)-S-oxide reductase
MNKTILSIIGLLVAALSLRAEAPKTEQATFGLGCFWCAEAIYVRQPGVIEVVSGFSGGAEKNPTYEQVCSGTTGHAECIQVTFDPSKTSYEKLVELFWKTHDVTDPRGVEPDFGKQYRSVIFYRNEAQRLTIEKSRTVVQKTLAKPIATQVVPFEAFYPAEAYHQHFVQMHPDHPYVRAVSIPKLKKLGLLP